MTTSTQMNHGGYEYLYFIHIPKTAGTYITRILKETLGDRFVREGHCAADRNLHPWTDRGWGPDACFTRVDKSLCLTFSVVRNPFALLVSMYLFGFPYWAPGWSGQHRKIVWPFSSFRDYVEKLCKWEDYPWICPPQKKSLFFQLHDNDGNYQVDYVIRQEQLEGGLSQLLEIFGTPVSLPEQRINVTNQKKSYIYKDFYDNELKALVEHHYESDLHKFGYDFNGYTDSVLLTRETLENQVETARLAPHGDIRVARQDESLSGRMADLDMHPWGSEILSQFSARQLAGELVRRIGKRVTK